MVRAVLITGANLGDVDATLGRAVELISQQIGRIEMLSTIRRSEAWGFEAPQIFGNQVVVVETLLEPMPLLENIWQIETILGRDREREAMLKNENQRYCSRTIDIDILFYGDQIIDTQRLSVPHPLISERAFVLEPLSEILPDYVDPRSGCSVTEMLESIYRNN